MNAVIAVAGALGIALVAAGLPPLRRIGFDERLAPHLNGLGGRASSPPKDAAAKGAILRWLQPKLAPLLPAGDAALVSRLATSGTTMSVQTFRLEQLLWATVAAAALPPLVVLTSASLPLLSATAAAPFAAGCGAIARDRWLSRQIAVRRERIRQELPVAIDLLTLAIMAGESIPAALARVGSVLGGDVGREFRSAFGSVRAGQTVADALEELGERLPHSSAARLADSLTIAMERGAPLAETLRAQADDLREARRRDLLEMGGRREIAMLVPVIFLILPTIVAFVLLPGLVSLDLLVP